VIDGLGYPDDGAGSNEQCLTIFCEGENRGGMIKHNDQFRGVTHSYLDTIGPGGTRFNFTSPDFFQLVPWSGEGLKPVGYGPDSISAIFHAARSLEEEIDGTSPEKTLELAQRRIDEIDEKGIIATPGNSYINELVVEGARLSIRNDGRFVDIRYDGDEPTVVLR
jgi:D-galacturonate reductase